MALPPDLAIYFTQGEHAVMAIIAEEHQQHGMCRLEVDDIAKRAACSRSVVGSALRTAIYAQLLARDEQRALRIISAEWRAWLELDERERVTEA